jgi:hypothetical protein
MAVIIIIARSERSCGYGTVHCYTIVARSRLHHHHAARIEQSVVWQVFQQAFVEGWKCNVQRKIFVI